MSIEINELSINTTIINEGEFPARNGIENIDYDKKELDIELLKQSILADCKLLISEMLERQRER
jgi:hypothetical protein